MRSISRWRGGPLVEVLVEQFRVAANCRGVFFLLGELPLVVDSQQVGVGGLMDGRLSDRRLAKSIGGGREMLLFLLDRRGGVCPLERLRKLGRLAGRGDRAII